MNRNIILINCVTNIVYFFVDANIFFHSSVYGKDNAPRFGQVKAKHYAKKYNGCFASFIFSLRALRGLDFLALRYCVADTDEREKIKFILGARAMFNT